MAKALAGLLLGAAGLAACLPPQDTPEPAAEEHETRPDIAPGDLVLLPCSAGTDRPCAVLIAGGKRLMFGAPAGAGQQADEADLADLEALFLFSVHPEDIAGVDEVRNRGWRAGRLDPLPLTGPVGTGVLVQGLNMAYEQPDAISFVEDGAPAGGFVAALLSHANDITEETLVYDSGDVKVRAAPGRNTWLSYRVGYRDLDETWHEIVMTPCGAETAVGDGEYEVEAANRLSVGCPVPQPVEEAASDAGETEVTEAETAGPDYAWPLEAPVFAEKTER
ncbi:hypothetical protein [Henriciella sp.]|uniref:hypothetical protein n=1 Tax=Henriciella sp. TaxID=1968823 RepID=UPI00262EF02C|nr:hypothetical protein [Henriciella sp.]